MRNKGVGQGLEIVFGLAKVTRWVQTLTWTPIGPRVQNLVKNEGVMIDKMWTRRFLGGCSQKFATLGQLQRIWAGKA